ncbi:hypothetical protein IQ254_23600 [Nodosilinea sp. LEGE 07088]|uniref:hypothetical protein n=1 Tax=Nodosilinea sp. LEGE 07088 TaxID=2777968 RepID=UPI00187F430B|nr:hypothetical protein [Nodosilinea sp. LEGE 07088]MBE9140146.1 hypothetical protein [Nodosilinea sp. LEGE 07088]
MPDVPAAGEINRWFPLAVQHRYVDQVTGQSGLTRRQAICFVRLWAYACYQRETGSAPIQTLNPEVNQLTCSHREAADLFYSDQPRGSERAAGLMINQLVKKHLVKRTTYDGYPSQLNLQIPPSFLPQTIADVTTEVEADAFDGRKDAPLVASFMDESYSWVSQRTEGASFKITRVLRRWATQYPKGLRVLRQVTDKAPVGFAAFYPAHPNSEERFHSHPSASLHLVTLEDTDPIELASSGDPDCYVVFVRAWQFKPQYWSYGHVCEFLADSQATLRAMQQEFPNLCDLYTITIHPNLEAFAVALGFNPMKADPASSLRWYYMALDHFLALDVDETLVEFDFSVPYLSS